MSEIKEGMLYKTVNIDSVEFNIYYGYESVNERNGGWEPSPIYPNFTERPQYTSAGYPFAVAYQDVCNYYDPKNTETDFIECANCKQFDKRDEFIGICKCPQRRERQNE